MVTSHDAKHLSIHMQDFYALKLVEKSCNSPSDRRLWGINNRRGGLVNSFIYLAIFLILLQRLDSGAFKNWSLALGDLD